ncbi:MAG: 4Fe-4S binding protein [Anaerolineae bacterium]|nr:4Fe-4S binding protein [Anaerolineae bacterium]
MIEIEADKCTGCRVCVETCPVGAIRVAGGVARVDAELCRQCGDCVSACPRGAITEVVPPVVVNLPKEPQVTAQLAAPVVTRSAGWLARVAPVAAAVASFVGREVLPLVLDRMASRAPDVGGAADSGVTTYPGYQRNRRQPGRQRHRQRGRRGF